jgi:hypothetical protein
MTVREICAVLEFDDAKKSRIDLTFGTISVPFNPANDLEVLAYGDFVIETCHIWEGGVELVLKQQFVKKGGAA